MTTVRQHSAWRGMIPAMPGQPTECPSIGRRCNTCGAEYTPHLVATAFRANVVHDASCTSRTRICRPCEQTTRDARKYPDRWKPKVRDVIRRHAKRFKVDKDTLINVYGWHPERLAHDAEYQYGNGCSYCGYPYSAMGHGLSDITLDIQYIDRPPYYRTNTKWCCQTCNRKKGDRDPAWFELDRQVYEVWNKHQIATAQDPNSAGFLF